MNTAEPRGIKPLIVVGSARLALRAFPEAVQDEAGHALLEVQRGREPKDWKPMPNVGPGVNELRVRDGIGAYRVFYVATFHDAIFVLHSFQKKTQRTDPRDIELGRRRFKQVLRDRP